MSWSKKLLVVFFLAAGMAVSAQNNVIKGGLTGAVMGDLNFGIERKITPKSSLQLKAGFLDPMSSPLLSDKNLLPEEYETAEVIGGLSASAEYRFYLNKKEGLRGFYLAPYARYFTQSMNAEVTESITIEGYTDDYTMTVAGDLTTYGAGLQLGYQWIIKRIITIDMYFLGGGIDFHTAEITYKADQVPDGFDYSMVTPFVDEVFSEIEFLNKHVEHEAREDHHYTKIPVKLPGFRAGISLGIAF